MEEFIVDFTGHNNKVTEHTKNHPDNSDGLSYNWNYIQFPLQIGKYYQITKYCDDLPIISFEQWRKNVLDSDDWNIEVKTEEQFNEVADFLVSEEYKNDKFWQNEKCGFDGGSKFIKKDDKSYGFGYNEIRNNSYPVEKSISWSEFQQLKNKTMKEAAKEFIDGYPTFFTKDKSFWSRAIENLLIENQNKMNISNGDVITLDNGDVVKVSLEIISQKITELIVGKSYKLKRTGSYCHTIQYTKSTDGGIDSDASYKYVGKIEVSIGDRYIFYSDNKNGNPSYTMFSTDVLDFVVKEIK